MLFNQFDPGHTALADIILQENVIYDFLKDCIESGGCAQRRSVWPAGLTRGSEISEITSFHSFMYNHSLEEVESRALVREKNAATTTEYVNCLRTTGFIEKKD